MCRVDLKSKKGDSKVGIEEEARACCKVEKRPGLMMLFGMVGKHSKPKATNAAQKASDGSKRVDWMRQTQIILNGKRHVTNLCHPL
ncbi:hypothetical protein SUGI_0815260 [Cryptomeria japonica]|nr:hypothetical protein SUGI_0815260 [Cryptomeria japonica]